MRSKSRIFLALAVVILLALGFYQNAQRSSPLPNEQLRTLLADASQSQGIDARLETTNCHVHGPLPDHRCTPGAIFADATPKEICVPGYTKTARSVSTALRKQAYQEYGVSYPQARGAYEVDHLIPLELGGSNDIANLFPEAAQPAPGFPEKDLVENYLSQEVCAGRIDLSAAQKLIAENWLAVYDTLSPEQLKALRQQFRNWAR